MCLELILQTEDLGRINPKRVQDVAKHVVLRKIIAVDECEPAYPGRGECVSDHRANGPAPDDDNMF